MRERPILFSAPMVRALLAGTKTQTRRIVQWRDVAPGLNLGFSGLGAFSCVPGLWTLESRRGDGAWERRCQPTRCPYGVAGDRLWVREAWRSVSDLDAFSGKRIAEMAVDAGYRAPWAPLQFEADQHRVNWQHTSMPPLDGPPQPGRYRHARFMPRWASRITLEVTEVRVERLQDISEADARAEGYELPSPPCIVDPLGWYRRLWEQINGPGSWKANPWVWVTSFPRMEAANA